MKKDLAKSQTLQPQILITAAPGLHTLPMALLCALRHAVDALRPVNNKSCSSKPWWFMLSSIHNYSKKHKGFTLGEMYRGEGLLQVIVDRARAQAFLDENISVSSHL